MKTKTCRGILHPDGVELPIDGFYFVISKTTGSKYYAHICKDCRCFISQCQITPTKRKKYHKTYNNTDKGRANLKKNKRLFNKRHPEVRRRNKRIKSKRDCDNLNPAYIKHFLKREMGFKYIPLEIIELKKLQLTLYRETKKQASCVKKQE